MGRREEIALRVMRGLVRRPRLADAVFRFDRWGNIVGPDRFVDPYPIYERMRESGPVSFSPLFQQWAIVGYEEAREVLHSPSFGVAGQMELLLDTRPYSQLSDQTRALFRNALLFTDPPLHTRLRAEVSRAFTPRKMQRLEPPIRAIVDHLLEGIANDPTPELMSSIAEPLPIQVIAELIGIPEERWGWITEISTVLRRALDPFIPLDPAEVDRTATDLTTYYDSLADERAAHPTDDLLTDLVRSEADGRINRTELLSLLVILVFAGHETTTGVIGNALVALGRNPEQRDLLRDRPDLWPNAVEELLRYDTVLQTDPRQALEDITIAGQAITAGQNVTVMLGAANRDPERFTDPDQLQVDRDDPAPLSFGHGMHHCIGAALARLELTVALPATLEALGSYEVDETRLEWKTSLAFRSPTHVRLHVSHPSA